MGLREASARRPNVVVMAPALTETAQSQNFKFASSVSLSLKEHQLKRADVANGMNGLSTTSPKPTTYSINGIAKNLKNEFLLLNHHQQQQHDGEYSDPNIGFTMNSGYEEPLAMGMVKPDKEAEDKSGEADMLKSLVVGNSEELSSTDMGQVEEILEAIQGTSDFEFEKDLFDVDVMNMCVDESLVAVNKEALIDEKIDEARKKYFLVTRKCAFLERRLKKIEARTLGKHTAEEITGIIEYTTNILEQANRGRSDSKPVPLSSMSLFMRQMDHAANQQATNVAKGSAKHFKYFGSGSSSSNLITTSNGLRSSLPGSVLPPYKPEIQREMETVSGELFTQLEKADRDIDSEATETSSGGESADENVTYNNQHQQSLSISKRCFWRWLEERANLASRWTWLQSQIADLEYRIRQQNEIRRQIRVAKGIVKLESDNSCEDGTTCARVRPLSHTNFNKRKVVQLSGFHRHNKKVARPASLRCACRGGLSSGASIVGSVSSNGGNTNEHSCGLCTGRAEPTCPRDPLEFAPVQERVALLDPTFHPVLSFPSDVSASLHYDAIMKCTDWQTRASRIQVKPSMSMSYHHMNNTSDTSLPENVNSLEARRGRKMTQFATTVPTSTLNNLNSNSSSNCTTSSKPQTQILMQDQLIDLERSKSAALAVSNKLRRKIARGRRRRKNMAVDRYNKHKRKNHGDSEGFEMGEDTNDTIMRYPSPVPSPAPSATSKDKDLSSIKRKRENSYDIDNIVIPYSMASATRLEKLNYKEILTPKWRRIKDNELKKDNLDHKNGVVRRSSHEVEGFEDMSEEAYISRHEKCEIEERKKFLSYLKVPNSGGSAITGGGSRHRSHKRADSRAESSGPNTPDVCLDPMSPNGSREGGDSLTSPPATPQAVQSEQGMEQIPQTSSNQPTSSLLMVRRRTVSASKTPGDQIFVEYVNEVMPYEARQFPLSEEAYTKMLAENSEANQNAYPTFEAHYGKQYDLESVDSPQSVTTDSADSLIGEDPNDPEWTSAEKTEKTKR
ncbi:KAT8 regulatory NSL complex subunit 1 isoform X2 [Cimex lectularius]|uniref:PEHE domain-containing protein n=1 Tax=Cimex lectularius TaxID=79782 RepID=A0A8I6S7D0_CIMLE|nr:KAT8 regulatory NSL complex subunit 1 isoform X2 [Cimex lectularius]